MADAVEGPERRLASRRRHGQGKKTHAQRPGGGPSTSPSPGHSIDVFQFLEKQGNPCVQSETPVGGLELAAPTLADDTEHDGRRRDFSDSGISSMGHESPDSLRRQIEAYEAHLAASRAADQASSGMLPGILEPHIEANVARNLGLPDDDDDDDDDDDNDNDEDGNGQLAKWDTGRRGMATHSPASAYESSARALDRAQIPAAVGAGSTVDAAASTEALGLAAARRSDGGGDAADDEAGEVVCRRFARLQERVLVQLQQELLELDDELAWVDERIDALQQPPLAASVFGQALRKLEFQRLDVLGRVFAKMNHYREALAAYSQQQAARPASPARVARYRGRLRPSIDAAFLRDGDGGDAVVVGGRRSTDGAARGLLLAGALLGAGGVLLGLAAAALLAALAAR